MMEKLRFFNCFKNCGSRGQFFSVDMIIAVVIFGIILISFFSINQYVNRHINSEERKNDLFTIAAYASSSLVETPGNPGEWYTYSNKDIEEGEDKKKVYSIGLSKNIDGWNLQQEKIDKLVELNESYDSLKNLLGVKGPGYELFVNVSYSGGQHIAGIFPNKAENIVSIERGALLNNQRAKVNVKVWA